MKLNKERQKERDNDLKSIERFEKSWWVFLVRKNRLTYLIIAFLLIFGVLTIGKLPRELNPEIEIPIAVVSSVYPGASPLDVEQQVTKKIESEISDLNGIKEINSTSSGSVSVITVEFEAEEDVEKSIQELKDEIDLVKGDLPDDVTDPMVQEISLSDEAIFTAVLAGENYDISQLKAFSEDLKNKLEGVSYVSEVKVVGGRDRVFKIDIDAEKATLKGLSANSILGALSANHLDFPAGSIEIDGLKYSVRVESEFKTVEELARMPVSYTSNGKEIFLEDVATVKEGFADETSRSRFALAGSDSEEAVSIQLFKKTGGDVTKVAATAREIVENGRGVEYPDDVQVEIISDQSTYITDSIDSLMSNGLGTIFIVFALLFFFLGWREALIAGLSIPFSFFIAFITMAIVGESLNFLSLFSLVLALGLLVDSAIVIVEGMYRKIARLGLSGYQAAIIVIKEHAAALLSGMLTTIAVFLPLMFVMGIMGQFIRTIPVVINITLIAALFVSLSIVPAIGALVLNPRKNKSLLNKECFSKSSGFFLKKIFNYIRFKCASKARSERLANKMFNFIANKYYDFIPKVIGTSKARISLILGSWVLFFIAISFVFVGFIKINAFTDVDGEFFSVNIELPQGVILEETDKVVKKIEDIIKNDSGVLNYTSSVGASSGSSLGGGSSSNEHLAFIYVNLTKTEDRKETSQDIIARLSDRLDKEITEAELSFFQEESGPPSGDPIELRVVGEDLLILERLAEDIKKELEQIPFVVSAKTSVKFAPGEIVFEPNKELISQKGLSVALIGMELNKGISRDYDLDISRGDDDLEIDFGYDKGNLSSVNAVENLLVSAPNGSSYALSELGNVDLRASFSSIVRKNEERVVNIGADTQGGNLGEIMTELQGRISQLQIPDGYRVDFGGEQEETLETFRDMFVKMIIGVILIFFVLVIQFNSYRQVFIIISTIPLAMVGVFFGMAISRLTLDFPAFIGVISLVGIVVNNAIILIDQINKELEEGKGLLSAVQEAGFSRLRPIVLTSITTIMGLLPLSISEPTWRNMGFAIIFGLTFSSLLTLFVVPATFVSLYNKKFKK